MKTNDYPVFTLAQLEEKGFGVQNSIIKSIDIDIVAHFGNCACLEILHDCGYSFCGCNDGALIGDMLRAIIEVLDLSEEDGLRLSKIKDVPCRLISSDKGGWGSKLLGFGNFMRDKFILAEDLRKWAICKLKERAANEK